MTSGNASSGMERCPSCDGELQPQDSINLQCLNCGDAFGHFWESGDTHVLLDENGEVVRRV